MELAAWNKTVHFAKQISVRIFQGPGQQWPNLQNLSKSEGIAKMNGITFALYL